MVFYFIPVDPNYTIYMGKNKEENEDLIKWGFPEDVWFHVDKYSSAHVYIRMKEGQLFDNIPPAVLEDCCQLVKANSIEGNKVSNITVVYTPWTNLKKTNGMDVGQVGFHDQKLVKTEKVLKRKNDIVNRLNKTRTEDYPDLQTLRLHRDKSERDEKKAITKEKEKKEKEEQEKKIKEKHSMSYDNIMVGENMVTNRENTRSVKEWEEDFM